MLKPWKNACDVWQMLYAAVSFKLKITLGTPGEFTVVPQDDLERSLGTIELVRSWVLESEQWKCGLWRLLHFPPFDTFYKVLGWVGITKSISPAFNKTCCMHSFCVLRFQSWGMPAFYLEFCTCVLWHISFTNTVWLGIKVVLAS